MMEPVQIGAIFFGMIRLGLLVHQDYTKKMLVDDRANYFMFGCYAMLISAHLFPL